ncbi:hypothetical protein AMTRI_Chr13g84300 [Amborella trichopoda]|uniref:Uncharacterized protein n=1 Tax=Amborella trichopoda TaxID=13333 RepID=W1NKP8_AMBTC|nr:uncharacterized protein LOC18423973 [Amborella trichopoda]ERM96046.1 hypothetical protein AMTR_s00129p00089860 [Amborella trichopoda]|eukprot:XP_006828630.1 uncharacterized protein LOC18423973 [Amborella trichopoda]
MAINGFNSSRFMSHDTCQSIRPVTMLHGRTQQIPRSKCAPIIKSTRNSKVFEDRERGIICYRDDSGEVICEGYDEGPHFHPRVTEKSANQSIEARILCILLQSRLRLID